MRDSPPKGGWFSLTPLWRNKNSGGVIIPPYSHKKNHFRPSPKEPKHHNTTNNTHLKRIQYIECHLPRHTHTKRHLSGHRHDEAACLQNNRENHPMYLCQNISTLNIHYKFWMWWWYVNCLTNSSILSYNNS